MKKYGKIFMNGIIDENPTFRMVLGMCPTLAITTAASNGIGMGLAVTFVLIFSNLVISLLRKAIPDEIRIPAFIVVIATFVTIVQLLIKAFLPALDASLGVFIPLIVVNCIIFGRAEAFAFKNKPLASVVDGLGMGLGFTLAITLISSIREILGSGTFFGMQVMPEAYSPIGIFVKAPGAFLVLAFLVAIMNAVGMKTRANKVVEGCDGCCAACSQSCTDKKEEKA